jgi:hypothetical protein
MGERKPGACLIAQCKHRNESFGLTRTTLHACSAEWLLTELGMPLDESSSPGFYIFFCFYSFIFFSSSFGRDDLELSAPASPALEARPDNRPDTLQLRYPAGHLAAGSAFQP